MSLNTSNFGLNLNNFRNFPPRQGSRQGLPPQQGFQQGPPPPARYGQNGPNNIRGPVNNNSGFGLQGLNFNGPNRFIDIRNNQGYGQFQNQGFPPTPPMGGPGRDGRQINLFQRY